MRILFEEINDFYSLYLLESNPDLSSLVNDLTEQERRYCFSENQPDLIINRVNLHWAIKKILDDPGTETVSKKGHAPRINRPYHVSFSHKLNFILIGLTSNSRKIGVDLEFVPRSSQFDSAFTKSLSAFERNEMEYFCQQNKISKTQASVIFFSLKESLAKMNRSALSTREYDLQFLNSQKFTAQFLGKNLDQTYQLQLYSHENFLMTACSEDQAYENSVDLRQSLSI